MRIKIVNLNKVYPGGKKALKDLNLEIEPGMFGLLGPNGAGKTSLMRIMTLLQSCTSGTIYFDDYDIAKDRKAIRSLLGYLPQDFRFFEKLKTWEFLDYGAGLGGIKGKQHRAEVVDEMLRKVGLFEVRDRWANRLSGGMKRRLGIAQAIIGNPKVIIVDEPTTGLHFADVHKLVEILQRLTEYGNTVVVIEHNLDVIKTADYIVDMGPEGGDCGGTVVATGTPEEIAGCPDSYTGQYVAKYLK